MEVRGGDYPTNAPKVAASILLVAFTTFHGSRNSSRSPSRHMTTSTISVTKGSNVEDLVEETRCLDPLF